MRENIAIDVAAATLAAALNAQAVSLAGGGDVPAMENTLLRAIRAHLSHAVPGADDRRVAWWRARVLIFDANGELVADTSPSSGLDEGPATLVASLGAVLHWATQCVAGYHGETTPPPELDRLHMMRFERNLRMSVNRAGKGGTGVVNMPYQTPIGRHVCRVLVIRPSQEEMS